MNTLHNQRGMSVLGVLFMLLVISFAGVCVVKLLPHYMTSWSLNSSIEKSIESGSYNNLSTGEIRSRLGKYMDVNRLDVISARDLKIKKAKGKTTIDARYEKRIPLMYNIDVVLKFEELLYEFDTK